MAQFLAGFAVALAGVAVTLVVGIWQRQAGRREGRLAEAAENRAQLAEHRAAALALLTVGELLAAQLSRRDPAAAETLARLRAAAAPVAWPSSSPLSAMAARVVLRAALVDVAWLALPACPGMRIRGPAGVSPVLALFAAAAAAEADAPGAVSREHAAGDVHWCAAMVASSERLLAL